jgi:hypothetical protein
MSPLRPGGAAAHHTGMTLSRTVFTLCLAMVVALAVAAMWPQERRDGGGAAAAAAPAPAAPPVVESAVPGPATSAFDGAQRLDAVRTVKLFCDLVDSRRLWRAAELFATPRVWPRHSLRAVRRLVFRSACIGLGPDAHTLVVIAQVRASGSPGSPVDDGDSTLFFTLGRVGTAGGWLISAVTSP